MRNNAIRHIESKHLKKEVLAFSPGDTVQVYVKIKEEGKTRLQVFEGIVIKRQRSGSRATFTVRRVSFGEGVERTFPFHSPLVDRIVVKRKGAVKRAKLYYLRKKKGKKSKVEEKIDYGKPSSSETTPPPSSEVTNPEVKE